jgi:hypothetical protein
MSDPQLEKILAHRLSDLDLGSGFVYPDYSGRSIVNLPSSICNLLGVPGLGAPALHADLLAQLGGPYRRVVFLLVDALAFSRLQKWMQLPEFAIWKQLSEKGSLAPLSSVSPSTTCAALTSLWTGRTPAEHGIAGYELWLKEYGLVANMIFHAPFSFERQVGSLQHAGFNPETFLGHRPLGAHLAQHGVQSYALQHHALLGTGLSTMFFPQVNKAGFFSPSDLWVSLRQLLESKTEENMFTWVYWPDVDTLSHKFGPDDERVRSEFASFTAGFERLFWNALSSDARKDTLFILAADHGHVLTEKDPHYDLRNHPGLTRRLYIKPTGENRLVLLYIKPGQIEAVREYIVRTWPNQFAVLDSGHAQSAGLFGPEPHSPRLTERIGDLVVAARGNAYWWWGAKENPLLGRHGGLTPEEMIVPLLSARLDA